MTQLVELLAPDLWLKCDDTNVSAGAVVANSGTGPFYVGTDWHFASDRWIASQPAAAPVDGTSVAIDASLGTPLGARMEIYAQPGDIYLGILLEGSTTKDGSAILMGFFEVPLLPPGGGGAFESRITEFGVTRVTEGGEVYIHDYVTG